MRINGIGAFCVVLVLGVCGGCSPRWHVDYSRFDARCREWQEQQWRGDEAAQHVAESQGMAAYYEYFMCINMRLRDYNHIEKMQYFFDHPQEYVRIVPAKFLHARNRKETYLLSFSLLLMHKGAYYDVASDKQLMDAWRDAISRLPYPDRSLEMDDYKKVMPSAVSGS